VVAGNPKAEYELAEMRAWIAELERQGALAEQFMADCSDDMECLPECDSLAHSDQCPVAHTDQAFRVLRERIAALEAALRPFAENGMAVSAAARTIARALLTQEGGG
jgi:hypothetical protein